MGEAINPLLRRITSDPAIFGGKPVVRGLRLSVEHVLDKLAVGETIDSLLAAWPFLERDDIAACLAFAAHMTGRADAVEALKSASHSPAGR